MCTVLMILAFKSIARAVSVTWRRKMTHLIWDLKTLGNRGF